MRRMAAVLLVVMAPYSAFAQGMVTQELMQKCAFLPNVDEQISCWSQEIGQNPSFAGLYAVRAGAYRKKGQSEKAIQDYTQALRLIPRHAVALNNRGEVYAQLGKREQAVADFKAALAINASYEAARKNLEKIEAVAASAQTAEQQSMSECARKWQAHKAATNASPDGYPSFVSKCFAEQSGKPPAATMPAAPARGVDLTMLKIGTYINNMVTCGEAANATIMKYDGKQFTASRYCAIPKDPKKGQAAFAVVLCPQEEEAPDLAPVSGTFTIKSPTEFVAERNTYRFCEQASLPEMWREDQAAAPRRVLTKKKKDTAQDTAAVRPPQPPSKPSECAQFFTGQPLIARTKGGVVSRQVFFPDGRATSEMLQGGTGTLACQWSNDENRLCRTCGDPSRAPTPLCLYLTEMGDTCSVSTVQGGPSIASWMLESEEAKRGTVPARAVTASPPARTVRDSVIPLIAHDVPAAVLPPDAITALLKSVDARSCMKIPVGRWQFEYNRETQRPQSPMNPEDLQNALWHEGQGFIRITFAGHLMGPVGAFDLTLRHPVDGQLLRRDQDGVCLAFTDYSGVTGKISKTEDVKGGRTGWKGTIAYMSLTNFGCKEVPAGFPNICRNSPANVRQFRVLFREKPFGDGWLILGHDLYVNNSFVTNNVLQALTAD
jgi:hypothetical protein